MGFKGFEKMQKSVWLQNIFIVSPANYTTNSPINHCSILGLKIWLNANLHWLRGSQHLFSVYTETSIVVSVHMNVNALSYARAALS
jgi:hypothetical protein